MNRELNRRAVAAVGAGFVCLAALGAAAVAVASNSEDNSRPTEVTQTDIRNGASPDSPAGSPSGEPSLGPSDVALSDPAFEGSGPPRNASGVCDGLSMLECARLVSTPGPNPDLATPPGTPSGDLSNVDPDGPYLPEHFRPTPRAESASPTTSAATNN